MSSRPNPLSLKKAATPADPLGVPDSFANHVADDLLEAYALAALEEENLAYVEEHLLICEDCRVRLQAMEEFVAGFQAISQTRGAGI